MMLHPSKLEFLANTNELLALPEVGPHKFKPYLTRTWGRFGGRSYTNWRCANCGVKFKHNYLTTPNIYKAVKDANIDLDNCTNQMEIKCLES